MNLLKECEGAKRIGISGHIRPDGDCVGSCLSLQAYLKKAFPEAEVRVFLQKPASCFSYLKGYDGILSWYYEKEAPFDVYFALDCNAERLGDFEKYFAAAKKRINIDHHISNAGDGDINLVRPEVGSCCEVLYELMDDSLLDEDIAEALYTGIIHDTGVFQYSNTRPETLQIAARLIPYGFNFSRIIEESFYQKTYLQTQIMGRALMESIRFLDGRCIVGMVDKKTMDFYNAKSSDLDGIVNQLRNIEGISCAIFMHEIGSLEFKVSLRTDERVNAAEVVSHFGGGGHMRAAGCTMKGTFHDCVNNLSLHIEKQLLSNENE